MSTKKNIIGALALISFFCTLPLFTPIHAQDVNNDTQGSSNTQITSQPTQNTPQQQTTYTVQYGDSLSSIAQSQLQDRNRWTDIYALNKDQISNPDIIFAGEVLQMPQNTPSTTIDTAVANLPNPTVLSTKHEVSQSIQSVSVPTYAASYTAIQSTYASVTAAKVPAQATTPQNQPVGASYYESMINAAAAQYGVSAAEMNHIIRCESGYNPKAYNPSGASGIAQFMPGTFYGAWNPYRSEGIWSAHAQIYAMADKMAHDGVSAWVCSRL